jgi:hypothetical protein
MAFVSVALSAPDVNGELKYGEGKHLETVVFEPRLLGTLGAVGKEPFLVFSGLGCSECDINRSIYIHSPSDPPMVSGELGARYSYPGRYHDYMSGKLVETVRMFVGRCTAGNKDVVVWFSNTKVDGGRWSKSTFLAKVEGQSLVEGFNTDRSLSVASVLAAAKHGCREVPGQKFGTEP